MIDINVYLPTRARIYKLSENANAVFEIGNDVSGITVFLAPEQLEDMLAVLHHAAQAGAAREPREPHSWHWSP